MIGQLANLVMGKNLVDGMGAVDKHTLYSATKKLIKPTDDEDLESKLTAVEIIRIMKLLQ